MTNMEWFDTGGFATGVTKIAIGMPSEEDLIRLKEEKYIHFCNNKTTPDDGSDPKPFQIWIK